MNVKGALVNGLVEIDFSRGQQEMDIVRLPSGKYHMLFNHRSYEVELLSKERNTVVLLLDGEYFEVALKDQWTALIESMGWDQDQSSVQSEVKSPMPGLIKKIDISVGDEVSDGDTLVIIEAMKMENLIKAPGDQKVMDILIQEGDIVDKNQVLIEFE